MQPKNSHFEIQRLLSLSAQVQLDLTGSFSGWADEPEDAINLRVAAACELLMRSLASRQQPQLSADTKEKWYRFAALLATLEQMSGRELLRLDNLAKLACASARSSIEELPGMLQATACASVAAIGPSPADLMATDTKRLVGRLRRQILFNVRAVVNHTARQLQTDLLRQLKEAVNDLYPLALTADEMLRAIQWAAANSKESQVCGSLVARLAKRRDQFQRAGETVDKGGDEKDYAFGFGAGALSNALCGFAPAALESLAASDLPDLRDAANGANAASNEIAADQRMEEFKQAALTAAHSLLMREWQSRKDGILDAVYGHVVGCFAELKLDMDNWFQEVERALATIAGRPIEAEQKSEAARFEVAAIWRQAGTGGKGV